MRFVLVAGFTHTGTIEGISAAGTAPGVLRHTPAADAEIVAYGAPIRSPVTPISPSGCPTPAIVTRAVRELLGFDLLVLDAGLAARTAAPVLGVGAQPGEDCREPTAVPEAAQILEEARTIGRALPDAELMIGESIPGGTTTALGVLAALGEPQHVSSSLPENPLALKREVVDTGLEQSDIEHGGVSGDPHRALQLMGDPVIAGMSGLAGGALETGTDVTLAGGTQMFAVAAVLRHLGVTDPIELATTAYVHADDSVDIEGTAAALEVELSVTDPGFDRADHPGLRAYCRGMGKEGVGMGGTLRYAEGQGISMDRVRTQAISCYHRVIDHNGS